MAMSKTLPRNCLDNPRDFGRKVNCKWRDSLDSADLATAEVQHRFAISVKERVRAEYGSLRAYCEDTDQNYQRLGRILRGELPLAINDIANASEHLGVSVSSIGAAKTKFKNDSEQHIKQVLVSSARSSLGAFYTPDDVAAKLVAQLRLSSASSVLEPSFGDGSFLRAAVSNGICVDNIVGCEIDPSACNHAVGAGYIYPDNIFHGSFFSYKTNNCFDAAIGNPPFVRIRSLSKLEAHLALESANRNLPTPVGEEASEWLPFVVKASESVRKGGAIAFVLPQDFTYLRYAKPAWRYLSNSFAELILIRIKERVFKDILQDVVLLIGLGKGAATDVVSFRCFRTIQDYLDDLAITDIPISIQEILGNKRPFQRALIKPSLLETLEESSLFCRASEEAAFHIGYVCGSKDYFHPGKDVICEYDLPSESLVPTVISSRQLSRIGYDTGEYEAPGMLWRPVGNLNKSETAYVSYGELSGVDKGYKCSRRTPWWRVPGVAIPQAILTVFGDLPRMLLNNGKWAVSNSLLGAYCHEGVCPDKFCSTWYSSLTRLSIELQVHSLGGGVLIAVPQEANSVLKIKSAHGSPSHAKAIKNAVDSGDIERAYQINDSIIANALGEEFLADIRQATNELVAWRKN